MTNSTDTYLEFTDASDIIRIEPIIFTFPKAKLDWDRNWIKTNVTLKGGVFSVPAPNKLDGFLKVV